MTIVFLLLVAFASAVQQTHIALTGKPGEIYVTYFTGNNVSGGVQYGLSSDKLNNNATSVVIEFTDDNYTMWVHDTLLTGLELETRYFYRTGSDANGWSKVFNFTTKTKNITYAVYGDLGYVNDMALAQLTAEVNDGVFQQVLHVGDFAYNFQDNNGTVGDDFMNAIQAVAAYAPYMTTPGNHENHNNFTEYRHRFHGIIRGLGPNSGAQSNLWYSWNAEFTHFVVIDTEMYNYSYDPVEVSNAIKWLEADLIAANKNRDKVPWIIMLGHKASWMDTTVWTDFDSLSHQYGVDVYFCGHQHNYDRMFPFHDGAGQTYDNVNLYTNPKYLVQIVSGSPGNKELTGTGLGPAAWRAVNNFNYGFGHLTVFNATHLYWEWEQTAASLSEIRNRAANVKDHLWIVQDNHGMRNY
jgi:hypothetical protein